MAANECDINVWKDWMANTSIIFGIQHPSGLPLGHIKKKYPNSLKIQNGGHHQVTNSTDTEDKTVTQWPKWAVNLPLA